LRISFVYLLFEVEFVTIECDDGGEKEGRLKITFRDYIYAFLMLVGEI